MSEPNVRTHGCPGQDGPITVGNLCFVSDETQLGERHPGTVYYLVQPDETVIEVEGTDQLVTSRNDDIEVGGNPLSYHNQYISDRGTRILVVPSSEADKDITIVGRQIVTISARS